MRPFLAILATLLLALNACSQAENSEAPQGKKSGSGNEDTDSEGNGTKSGSNGSGGGSSKTDNGGDVDDPEDDDDSTDGNSGSSCQTFTSDLSGDIDVTGKANALITKIDFHLVGSAAATFKRNKSDANLKIDVKLTEVTPALAKSMAENTVTAYRDPLKLTLADAKDGQARHDKTSGWKGLHCLVLPVKRLENNKMIFEYEPALPLIIAPNLDDDAYQKLKSSLTISNIKAKVVKSPNTQVVQSGASFNGKATISPGSGGSYSIKFDFGGFANTTKATPFSQIDYTISNGDFSSLTVHVPVDAESAVPIKLNK